MQYHKSKTQTRSHKVFKLISDKTMVVDGKISIFALFNDNIILN